MMDQTYFASLAASNASQGCGHNIVISVKSNEVTATSQSHCVCLMPHQLGSLCITGSQLYIIYSRCNANILQYNIQNGSFKKVYHVLVLHFFNPSAIPLFISAAAFLASCCVLSCSCLAPCDLRSSVASSLCCKFRSSNNATGDTKDQGSTLHSKWALWKAWVLIMWWGIGWCTTNSSITLELVHSSTRSQIPEALHFAKPQSCCTLKSNRTSFV